MGLGSSRRRQIKVHLLAALLLVLHFLAAPGPPSKCLATSTSDMEAPDPFTLPGLDPLLRAVSPAARAVMGVAVETAGPNNVLGVTMGDLVRFSSSLLQTEEEMVRPAVQLQNSGDLTAGR